MKWNLWPDCCHGNNCLRHQGAGFLPIQYSRNIEHPYIEWQSEHLWYNTRGTASHLLSLLIYGHDVVLYFRYVNLRAYVLYM